MPLLQGKHRSNSSLQDEIVDVSVGSDGRVMTEDAYPISYSSTSRVSSSDTSVELLGVNDGRIGFIIVNESSASLKIKFGSGASAESYSIEIPPAFTYAPEPWIRRYTGIISGIWDSAIGAAQVTEF